MIILKLRCGLGNQLFQYATAYSASQILDTGLFFDLSFYENPPDKSILRLDKFNLIDKVANEYEVNILKNSDKNSKLANLFHKFGVDIVPYYKKSHITDQNVDWFFKKVGKEIIAKDYYFEGWFSNHIHFERYREDLLKLFNGDFILDEGEYRIIENITNLNSIAIHIRRGDYVINDYFNSLSVGYYMNAIEQMNSRFKDAAYFFFSDDIDWVKFTFGNNKSFMFNDHNSEKKSNFNNAQDIKDLMLMRLCKHQIIANSTFSWWGAWLNNNSHKLVIAPKLWFKDPAANVKIKYENLYPKGWIVL